jgi:hypothetical protein
MEWAGKPPCIALQDQELGASQDTAHLPPGAAARRQRSVFVVGDPDQAIYGWRGAEAGNMRSMFQKDFPHSQVGGRARENPGGAVLRYEALGRQGTGVCAEVAVCQTA